MKSNLILANPTSGRGRGARVLAETMEYLERNRLRYQVIASSSLAQSLNELSQISLSEYERVLVVGGDGMIHHAINALAKNTESAVPVGIVPAGTGNDFARALGLDVKRPSKNLDLFLSSESKAVDLGEVNGTRFGAICSTGFDSISRD